MFVEGKFPTWLNLVNQHQLDRFAASARTAHANTPVIAIVSNEYDGSNRKSRWEGVAGGYDEATSRKLPVDKTENSLP